jgi:A/G-specific adenine glycosylase
MLQQTQVATVLNGGYFERWMRLFPTVDTLARADRQAVLKAWEGLGYYRRAENLQRTARAVAEHWGGVFPDTDEELRRLPGVGRYTAGAILCFALNRPCAVVDANVARVLARLFNYHGAVDGPEGRRQLWAWAEALVAPRRARAFNAGWMELGQRICLPRRPRCGECPVRSFCRAAEPELLPVRSGSRKSVSIDEHAVFAVLRGRILMEQPKTGRRAGLWKLPERRPEELEGKALALTMRYSITHHRVLLRVYADGKSAAGKLRPGERWVPAGELPELPVGSPYRKVLNKLLPGDAR